MAPRKAPANKTRAVSSSARAPAASKKPTTTRTAASKEAASSIKAPIEATKPAPRASKRKRDEDDTPAAAASKKAKTTTTSAPKKATTTAKPAGRPKKAATGTKAPAKATKPPAATATTSTTTTTKRKRAAEDGPPAIKKPKKGPVINEAPTQKLDVYVCGEGESGELGLGTAKLAKDAKRARLNPLLAKEKVGVVKLECGGMHVVAITHDNKILTWGVNDQGALGRDTAWDGGVRDIDAEDSDSDSADDNGLNPLEASPGEVDWSHTELPEGTKFTDVAAGDSCSFAVTDDGNVYGWGTFRDNNGIFGFTEKDNVITRPVKIQKLSKITSVKCTANAAFALTKTGQVFAWGAGEGDQLGHRTILRNKETTLTPRPMGLPHAAKTGITSIHPGSDHCFAISKNGNVWAWGSNNYGQTGITDKVGTDNASVTTPTIVTALKGKEVSDIAAGTHHAIASTKSGEVLAWGRIDSHQLGLDNAEMEKLPEDMVMRSEETGKMRVVLVPQKVDVDGDVVMVAAASDHSLAITRDGAAYSWGFNANYQIGQGNDDDDVAEPTKMIGKAIEGKQIVGAGSGGQFSVLLGA